MSSHGETLHPGALYLTISLPSRLHSRPWDLPGQMTDAYPTQLPDDLDPETYEATSEGACNEEFDWGLYWHRGPGDGIWYTVRRKTHRELPPPPGFDIKPPPGFDYTPVYINNGMKPNDFALEHTLLVPCANNMEQSPRLRHSIVGMVRIAKQSEFTPDEDLESYLNWLTVHMSGGVNKSFVWATAVFMRVRSHLVEKASQDAPEDEAIQMEDEKETGTVVKEWQAPDFEPEGFLTEALGFAYQETAYALSGQLPRPILLSKYGIEVGDFILLRTSVNLTLCRKSIRSRRSVDCSPGTFPRPKSEKDEPRNDARLAWSKNIYVV